MLLFKASSSVKKKFETVKSLLLLVKSFSASKRLLPLKSYNFNGLTNLSVRKVGSVYKYFFGLTTNYNEAKKLLRKSKSHGYKSSFIVLEKNGKPYDLDKYLNEI